MNALMGLYEQALPIFAELVAELAGAGLPMRRGVELRRGAGLLTYFDRDDGHIYLCLACGEDPKGQLAGLYLSSLLGITTAELDRLIRFLLPWTLAHELGHCLRHHEGMFGDDLFVEERAANDFASALTGAFYEGAERRAGVALVERAAAHLQREHPLPRDLASGLDLLAAETRGGAPRDSAALSAFTRRFSADYTADPAAYIGIQMVWISAYLRAPRRALDEVARAHLART
ncbi:uncharacterized protein SOCE26_066260 [Sorangium cellulosum]|uniref:Uncharacterized protein n=1 Tax=Sorangium cellulosum TaxID=56 RepID=A0A2L0F0R6_SORCE|nr:hypothetical protein [Sorangium cellulosum]AUX45145.1 uncharacterized protein SOCE26_066260 [Sorangium cellulosum]